MIASVQQCSNTTSCSLPLTYWNPIAWICDSKITFLLISVLLSLMWGLFNNMIRRRRLIWDCTICNGAFMWILKGLIMLFTTMFSGILKNEPFTHLGLYMDFIDCQNCSLLYELCKEHKSSSILQWQRKWLHLAQSRGLSVSSTIYF